jgi:hypothetical protein
MEPFGFQILPDSLVDAVGNSDKTLYVNKSLAQGRLSRTYEAFLVSIFVSWVAHSPLASTTRLSIRFVSMVCAVPLVENRAGHSIERPV